METSEQTATNLDGTTGPTKETPMNTAATTPETRNTQWHFPALVAGVAIGAAALLSIAVYGGYLWGGGGADEQSEQASEQSAVPVPADPETGVINSLGE